MKAKTTRRALLLSVLSLLLCCSMLVGTTFAWFTDSVTSGRNTIVAGNLDIVLEYWDGDSYEEVTSTTKLFDDNALWEPGYTEVAYLKVSNAGSLALKYQLAVNVYNEILGKTKTGADIKLSDYLQFKVVESDTDLVGAYASREAAQAADAAATNLKTYSSDVKPLDPKDGANDKDYVALIIYMPTTVGNEANHNGTNVPKIDLGINVFATQLQAEEDSFGKDYDKDAEYDSNAVVNGNATESTKLSTENTQVEIPAGAEGGTYVLETSEITTTEKDGVVTATMDITLLRNGEKATTTAEPFKVIVNIGAGLNLTKVLHNNVELTGYTYDIATGDLTFETTHFSPFTFVYDTVGATVKTAEELNAALANGGLITLGADITSSAKFVVTKSTVINGNGKTITYTGTDRAIDVSDNADAKVNVAIENLTVNCAGSYCQRGVNYNDDGALVLNNVTIKGTNVTYALNLPGYSDNCVVEINNCDITGNIAMNIWGANSKVTATNTIFTSVDNSTVEGYVAISLNNDGAGNAATGAVVNINGGKIIAKNEKGEASTAVRVETVATVNVSAETEVIGSIVREVAIVTYEGYDEFYSFDNLQEAIDKAAENANATVKLLENIELTKSVEIPERYTVTIDLNGKNIGTSSSTEGCPLYLKGGKLTIKNGTLALDGSGTNEHGTFATAIGYDAQTELVVENVTFTGQTAINGTFATNGPLTITVSNSTINTTNVGIAVAGESPDAIATVNNCNINAGKYAIFASQGAKITINGGTYKSAENVITSMYEGSVVTVNGGSFEGNLLITAKGALVVKGGTFNVDPSAYVADGYEVINNGDGTYTVKKQDIVYNNTVMGDLYTFLPTLKSGDVLILPAKTYVTTGTFTIPAGVTIKGEAGAEVVIRQDNPYQDNIFDCQGDVVIENITFESNRKGYAINGVDHESSFDITVINCKFKGLAAEKNWGIYKNSHGNLTVQNCTFDNYNNAICGVKNLGGSTTVITGCTFTNIVGEAIGYVSADVPADFEATAIANNTGLTAENVIGW